MPKSFPEVPLSRLRATIDPQSLPFETTASLEPPAERILGQDRASDAIKFGMGMRGRGYHIFIAGPPKAGLTYTARTYIEEQARKEPTPPDWCYVHDFKEPDRPKSLRLSAGRGKELKKDMQEMVEAFQTRVGEAFDSDDYSTREGEVQKGFERERRRIIEDLSQMVKEEGFILQVSQMGMVILP
ncbi:MAG: AAA family ATPase, partial [Deltaproteobacteria bacterium]|nr:AAA family ATPase [Deltaproteobacteria bacterium]